MKKIFSFILVLTSIFVLSSCSGLHYIETEYTIDDYSVYQYDHKFSQTECDKISKFGLFVRDGDDDYVTAKDFGECLSTLFVRSNGDYLNLSNAIDFDLFSIEAVLEVDWDFKVYETHPLLEYTEVDYFVFHKGEDSQTYDDSDNITRVLEISESIYQRFIIEYYPKLTLSLGTIDVYYDTSLVATLIVYEEGIYDPTTDAFQEMHSSELYGLYLSIMQWQKNAI